jgi:hypothetical protein
MLRIGNRSNGTGIGSLAVAFDLLKLAPEGRYEIGMVVLPVPDENAARVGPPGRQPLRGRTRVTHVPFTALGNEPRRRQRIFAQRRERGRFARSAQHRSWSGEPE